MDVYKIVTDKILALLEQGTIPWEAPASGAMPMNLVSGKTYNGINAMLLYGGATPLWLTYNQAKALGGYVKKGEKSSIAIFWKMLDMTKTDNKTENKTETKQFPMIRYYSVFNVSQCEGLPAKKIAEYAVRDNQEIRDCQSIIDNMPCKPKITFGTSHTPCYSKTTDEVYLPAREAFVSSERIYKTMFHELIHSTGHSTRLARKSLLDIAAFGDHSYSHEELVDEMGAAFLAYHSGIHESTIDNSAAYIDGWMRTIKANDKILVIAATQANKASNYILNKESNANR